MGINSDSDQEATLRIGPTSLGMVRVYVETAGVSLPMDFDPSEALEIAEELTAAAARAQSLGAEERARRDRGGQR